MNTQYWTTTFNSAPSKEVILSSSSIPVTNGLVLFSCYDFNEWYNIFHRYLWKELFNNAKLNVLANSCLSCFPLASSLSSSGGRVNLLTKTSCRVMLIITEGLSFSSLFLFQLPLFQGNLCSAVQLWNFSILSNSSPAPSCNPTQQCFSLNLFGIQTVFGISPTVHSQSSIWEAASLVLSWSYLWGFPVVVSAAYTIHFKSIYLQFYDVWFTSSLLSNYHCHSVPHPGQEVMVSDWRRIDVLELIQYECIFLQWGLWNMITGSPDMPHPWKHSRSSWMGLWAIP